MDGQTNLGPSKVTTETLQFLLDSVMHQVTEMKRDQVEMMRVQVTLTQALEQVSDTFERWTKKIELHSEQLIALQKDMEHAQKSKNDDDKRSHQRMTLVVSWTAIIISVFMMIVQIYGMATRANVQ